MSSRSSVMVGIWTSSPCEAEILTRALEERLRNIGAEHPDRHQLEIWRRQTRNFVARAEAEEWSGWILEASK